MALCLRWPLLACCALLAHPLLILGKLPCQTAARATSPAAPEPPPPGQTDATISDPRHTYCGEVHSMLRLGRALGYPWSTSCFILSDLLCNTVQDHMIPVLIAAENCVLIILTWMIHKNLGLPLRSQ